MINAKTIIGVIIVAVLIGVVYVYFEKNFFSAKKIANSPTSPAQALPKDAPTQAMIISLPTPQPALAPIDESSDLLKEASSLEMRDYSSYFEELKDKVQE